MDLDLLFEIIDLADVFEVVVGLESDDVGVFALEGLAKQEVAAVARVLHHAVAVREVYGVVEAVGEFAGEVGLEANGREGQQPVFELDVHLAVVSLEEVGVGRAVHLVLRKEVDLENGKLFALVFELDEDAIGGGEHVVDEGVVVADGLDLGRVDVVRRVLEDGHLHVADAHLHVREEVLARLDVGLEQHGLLAQYLIDFEVILVDQPVLADDEVESDGDGTVDGVVNVDDEVFIGVAGDGELDVESVPVLLLQVVLQHEPLPALVYVIHIHVGLEEGKGLLDERGGGGEQLAEFHSQLESAYAAFGTVREAGGFAFGELEDARDAGLDGRAHRVFVEVEVEGAGLGNLVYD